jgi:hypothetical protein
MIYSERREQHSTVSGMQRPSAAEKEVAETTVDFSSAC